ncbi:thiamine-phosphate kinase [Gimibacter soli]|uniref:Thiamine-monophosphate kinase n=1 Tax=Gimibacter soli TaxID=3024400 RepID=A0AAE9XQC8_9PROT|nr:thiamine-phosphate kinase [Gimibacter soli]WCL52990.1 thiamine-phosphate kinase [Gimibacter soli]
MSREFDLIGRCFAPLAGPEGLGLLDDAALFSPTQGRDLVITKDVLTEGIHFLSDVDPVTLGWKALMVNLSDLAAKSASPRLYFVGLSAPKDTPDSWFEGFAEGLRAAQEAGGLTLAGGDSTGSTGPRTISITAIGECPAGAMIRRNGATVGDDIWVSGTLGDAALALGAMLKGGEPDAALRQRLEQPVARLELGTQLRGLATASADVSDGLIADAGHIAKASGVQMVVERTLLPVSEAALACLKENPGLDHCIWSGGDDYELVFTAPAFLREKILAAGTLAGVPVTRVGRVETGEGVVMVDQAGVPVQTGAGGYSHFGD